MNFIKNTPLKYKPLIVFAILAIINATGIYLLKQFAIDEIAESVIPTQRIVGEFGFLTKEVQAETLEYISSGEEEAIEQLAQTSAELTTLAERLTTLAQDDEELEILVANEATALNILNVSEELIANHGETLALLEAFEEAEQEKDASTALFNQTEFTDESGRTAELITQALNQGDKIQAETLEYVLTGEETSLSDLNNHLTILPAVIGELQTMLAADNSDQAQQLQTILSSVEHQAQLSEQITANHTETLELLQELEDLEGWAEETRLALLGLLENKVATISRRANGVAWVSGLAVQIVFMVVGLALARTVVKPVAELVEAANELTQGNLDARLKVRSRDEIGILMTGFNEMAARMQQAMGALQQQSQSLSASSEVSRRLSTILDPAELTTAVVELLQITFNYYHAHIYLYDDAREFLVMVGGTGEAGLAMLDNNHKIEAGKGLVGKTAESNKYTLVPDVTADSNWLPNPLLPETKAEAAVPITLDNEVLGVLDIQNNTVNSLDETDIELLQSVARQVAVGLQNAKLFSQAEKEKGQMETILAALSTPIVISRISSGRVAYVNDALVETFKLPREQLVGQVTPDFYADPEDRARFLLALREHGVASEFEMVLKRGNGELFWSMISGRIISYEGQPAIVSSVVDINARKRAEELLAKQANELSIVAKVSTAAATTLEPQELLQQVVDLTKSSFELYHAHIHLLDEATQMLSLTAGAGDVGRAMVAEGRYIPLTANGSLVAAVARSNAGAIRHYESPEEGFMPHPLLTETRSEMAVPIAIGSQVLGVLDVRSDKLNYFRESDLRTVTTLASQVAVALQNARSYTRSEAAIQELQEISRRLTREGWDEFVEQQVEELTFAYLQEHLGNAQAEAAGQNGHHGAVLSQPLQVQGEPIGELLLEGAAPHRDESIEIVQAVADHLSAHLENLRLAEQSERDRAAAEKRSQEMAIINEIVTQISTSLDLQHSLQIIVDELATAVNVDQVRVALIQPNQQDMLVIAEHFDATRTPSAVGMTIPLEGNELTLNVINTRQMAVIEDAQNNPRTAPVHELFREQGIETVILLPLVVNDEVIGTVGMDILDKRSLPRESLRLAETIVYQTATAIQNARLFEQIQSALAETEMLYSYSSQLNTATSLDAVLDSAVAPGFQVGATKALLLVYDRNSAGNPEYGQIAAVLPRESAKVGASLYLAEQPVRHLWPSSGQNTVFVGDVWADGRLSPQDKEAFSQQDVRAVAIMYLTVGNLRLGQILIYWNKQQTFTNADERLYGAIAQQASSVVYNRLLFNQTEEALSETAALYQASADLNTAQTFEAVLTSLRQHTILGQASNDVTISFFNRNWEKDQIPEEIHVLASWQGLSAEMPSRYKLDAFPQAKDLLSYDEIRIYEDIVNDERINEEGRATFIEKFKTYAFVYAPLIIGTKRVGFISGFYPEAMSFSDGQIRRLNVLTRQAAVSLQSIRLYEQTQEALAQTEALYTGSERIVLSSTEDEILHSLVDSTELRTLDRANVFMFDQPVEDGVARDVTVVATWVNEGVPASVEVGTRFEVAHVPFLSSVNPEKSLVIHDIRTDPSVDEQTREILEGFGMISFVMFPIVVGSQWLGMVSGQSSRPLQMNEVHMRQANSLVSQAAVVMQTTILFRQEQARARREHLLREIAAKVRSSSDIDTIMRTAVTEIGRTLGRRTFIKLNNEQSDSDQKVANGVTP